MATSTVSLERKRKLFVVEETTPGTLEDHAAADGVRHVGAELTFTQEQELVEDADGDVAASELVDKEKTGGMAFPAVHLRPSGSDGGLGEYDAIIEGIIGTKGSAITATTVNDASATETVIILNSVTGMQVGDILYFGGTLKECAVIDSIETLTVTLKTPLSVAPANSSAVNGGFQFRPADDLKRYSCFVDLEHAQRAMAGVLFNEGTFAWATGQTVQLSGTGIVSGKRSYTGTSTIDNSSGIDGVADPATIELPTGHGRKFSVEGGDLYIQIEDEILLVTAVDTTSTPNTLTATRAQKSSSIATHAKDVAVAPWLATPTKTGDPLAGIRGALVIEYDGARIPVRLQSANMSVNNGYVYEADFGDLTGTECFRSGARPRSANWEMVARFDVAAMGLFGAAEQNVDASIVVWGGDTIGRIIAGGSRRVRFTVPDLSGGVAGQVIKTLTGMALDTVLGERDEFRFALL